MSILKALRDNIGFLAVVALAFIAAGGFGSAWWTNLHPPVRPLPDPVVMDTPRTIEKLGKITAKLEACEARVIPKEKIFESGKWKLPELVIEDKAQEVVETGVVQKHNVDIEITATLNTQTGDFKLYQRHLEPAFLQFTNLWRLGFRGGVSGDSQGGRYGGMPRGSWVPGRLGPFHLEAYMEIAGILWRVQASGLLSAAI